VNLYFRNVDELAAHKAAAEAGGYANFNAWLLQMIANATSGSVYPPEYVEGLKREVEKLRAWLDTARDEAADYRSQVKVLQNERDVLLTLLHGLTGGPEIAARFLEQSSTRRASQ
jgi:hypothetical protein